MVIKSIKQVDMNHIFQFNIKEKSLFIVLISLFVGICCQAQNDTLKAILHSARKYQYGINRDVDINKAKSLYKKAVNSNSPDALNALGWLYLTEHGANRDGKKAFKLFETAAKKNYPKALCNLGHMYHSEFNVVPQDFKKAYQLYQQAADSNFTKAYYLTGYMLYKGLGVEQNYAKAIGYFKKGAAKGNHRCIYMLGICYMHGYGLKQNFDSAKAYFNQALKKGDGQVVDIIANNTIDSIKNHPIKDVSALTDVIKHRFNPQTMPVRGVTFSTDSLQGRWTGKLYTYDWSRTIVEKEEDIILELQSNNGSLSGNWYLNEKLVTQFQQERSGQVWKVSSDIQADSTHTPFRLQSIDCKVLTKGNSAVLTGDIVCTGKRSHEPKKPSYFILDKENAITSVVGRDTTFVINRIYPNPFKNQFQIDFTVRKQDNISFQIHDVAGLLYYTSDKKQYNPGIYSITINASLNKGDYNLEALGQQYQWSQSIIKN